MKQIRVLQLVPGLASGGISSVLLNYYRHMDREKVHFDFCVFMPELGKSAEEFKKMGSEIYVLPKKSKDMRAYKEKLMKIIREGNYDVVHAHQNYQSFIPLRYAKKCGVKVRIAHAHSTKIDHVNFKKRILLFLSRLFNVFYVTDYMACGKDAGRAMFGAVENKKNFKVLKNAVENGRFFFSPEVRDRVRKDMDWQDKLVIGNIGRLSQQKNQLFLMEIFSEITKLSENAILCICGEGEDRAKVEEKIRELKLGEKVFLLGNRSDVAELMNGFDVFLLPSLFEGLPVTGIETLTNGLPSVMSDTITREFDEYGKVRFIPLDAPLDVWAEAVLDAAREGHDADMSAKMKSSGYDIADAAEGLENDYINRVLESDRER